MIREAVSADIPRLLEMGQKFYETAGWPAYVDWDGPSVERTLQFLIDSPQGGLFVADADGEAVGMTGGMVAPHYFNLNVMTGQELFWWVEPEHRGMGSGLFDALENWATSTGAVMFTMVAVDKIKPEVMARVYRARGYTPAEHTHIRRL